MDDLRSLLVCANFIRLCQGLIRIFVFSDPTIRIPQLVWPTLLWMTPLLFLEIIAKDVLEGR
jgi:hypothetical protein